MWGYGGRCRRCRCEYGGRSIASWCWINADYGGLRVLYKRMWRLNSIVQTCKKRWWRRKCNSMGRILYEDCFVIRDKNTTLHSYGRVQHPIYSRSREVKYGTWPVKNIYSARHWVNCSNISRAFAKSVTHLLISWYIYVTIFQIQWKGS